MKFYQYDIRNLSEEQYDRYYSLMSKEKKLRVDRFRFQGDKKRTVAGEMLARQAIAEWCDVAEESIILDKTEYGKPYAKNLNIEFNISHFANIVVCVVDVNPVGIDVEKICPIDLNTVKRIFNKEEIQYIFGYLPNCDNYNQYLNDAVLQRFFELWTKKEAHGKCIGTGLFTESKAEVKFKSWTEDGNCISIAELIGRLI